MRLFIAINFNNATRARLLALRDELRDRSRGGNFSSPENLHLTLAFLGACDPGQTAAAKSALGALGFARFDIRIDCVGRFERNGGDIWWAGVRACAPRFALWRDLTDRLAAAGFACEARKLSPHVTLGREVLTDVKPRRIEPFGEAVGTIALMKSERIDGKLTYTAIARKDAGR